MSDVFHTPVLVEETLRFLPRVENGIYVDGTLGGGGYAMRIMEMLPAGARLIGFDRDAEAIAHARERMKPYGDKVLFIHDNFKSLSYRLREAGYDHIDCLLLDLGVSSHQINRAERGFTFQTDVHLDMRMDRRQKLDAWTVVNTYPKEQLAKIFYTYGEERFSGRIAGMIARAREKAPIDSTRDLAAIVELTVGARMLVKSLARIFQAIRIEVNGELDDLRTVLQAVPEVMAPGGRLLVIAYHSLEDRIVKKFIKTESQSTIPSGNKLVPDLVVSPRLLELTRKPVVPSEEEMMNNPRSRSAKLRVAERL